MKLILSNSAIYKSKAELGKDKGGSYIKRVVTGKDRDGSPQYRYLRTPAEVAAYEKKHKDDKVTHEKQKEHTKEIEGKASKDKDEEDKKDKKPSLLVSKDKKKVEKSLYVR